MIRRRGQRRQTFGEDVQLIHGPAGAINVVGQTSDSAINRYIIETIYDLHRLISINRAKIRIRRGGAGRASPAPPGTCTYMSPRQREGKQS